MNCQLCHIRDGLTGLRSELREVGMLACQADRQFDPRVGGR
jgi:hypothetical protein